MDGWYTQQWILTSEWATPRIRHLGPLREEPEFCKSTQSRTPGNIKYILGVCLQENKVIFVCDTFFPFNTHVWVWDRFRRLSPLFL